MPKLSENGLLQAKQLLERIDEIPNTRGTSAKKLSMLATKVILKEVICDIENKKDNNSVTLQKLNLDDRLEIDFNRFRQLGWHQEGEAKTLSEDEIDQLWVNSCIAGKGVSQRTARNFLDRQEVNENACKYFCKGLQVVYTKVIESDNLLNPVQIALTEFDHTQQLQDFEQKVRYKKTIPLFCQINKDGYLPLKWLLLRCLNHNYNGNNYQTLFIKFSLSTTTVLADERTALQYLKQKLIKCLNRKVYPPPFQPSTKLSEIGKILARDFLFKQNIVLVFDGKFQQNIMIKFWKILIKYLQIALTETDHCLLLLVVDDCPHNNYQYFQQINIKQEFSRDELLLWLNNQRVKQLLNLQNEEELIATTNIIWQNSQTGQPEALLQAIYQQFNYNKWDEEKDQWYSLSN